MLASTRALCFYRKFLCFRFSRSLKKGDEQGFGPSFAVVFVIKLRLYKGGALVSDSLALLLIFFKSLIIFTICDH